MKINSNINSITIKYINLLQPKSSMGVKRKTSTKKYLLAFVLTLVIFSGGIVVGIVLENARLSSAQEMTLQEKVNLRSLQLQQKYIDSGTADCKTLHTILENNIDELSRKMATITDYEQKAVFNEEEFNLQLQDYFLTEIQFYLLSQEIDQKCRPDSVKVIYFYDENADDTQGDILRYLKKKFDSKLLVFSLNSAFTREPMIKTLLTSYKITQFPSMVVEDEVFQGHRNVKETMDIICRKFLETGIDLPEECSIVN